MNEPITRGPGNPNLGSVCQNCGEKLTALYIRSKTGKQSEKKRKVSVDEYLVVKDVFFRETTLPPGTKLSIPTGKMKTSNTWVNVAYWCMDCQRVSFKAMDENGDDILVDYTKSSPFYDVSPDEYLPTALPPSIVVEPATEQEPLFDDAPMPNQRGGSVDALERMRKDSGMSPETHPFSDAPARLFGETEEDEE